MDIQILDAMRTVVAQQETSPTIDILLHKATFVGATAPGADGLTRASILVAQCEDLGGICATVLLQPGATVTNVQQMVSIQVRSLLSHVRRNFLQIFAS